MDDPVHRCTRLKTVHLGIHSNEGVIVLTLAQIGMK